MIFVTVGTGKFELLVKEVDKLVPKLKEKVVAQIGSGKYTPKNCKWFRFAPNLKRYYKQANLIISHGGPGTVFEILDIGKPLIALANRNRTDAQHQAEFLRAISKESKALIYCRNISDLYKTIQKAKSTKLEKYKRPRCQIAKIIEEFIADANQKKNALYYPKSLC